MGTNKITKLFVTCSNNNMTTTFFKILFAHLKFPPVKNIKYEI